MLLLHKMARRVVEKHVIIKLEEESDRCVSSYRTYEDVVSDYSRFCVLINVHVLRPILISFPIS